jgi:alkylation response protein AidB-like acyl-CoA dehydrogenase
VTQRAKGKGRGFNDSLLGDRETFQRDLGKFDIELIAMRSMIFDLFGEVWDGLPPGEQPAPAQQAQMRSAATLATEVALEVARNSFRYAGGEAVYGSDPIQKCWRDLATASQHFLVSDSAYENHAKFLLGREDANAFG